MKILSSPKLTTLTQDLNRLKALASQSREKVWKLTKTLHPTNLDSTVSNVTYAKPRNYAWIGFEDVPRSVVSVDSEQNETTRNEELKLTLAGNTIAPTVSVTEQLETEQRQWQAYEHAIEFRTREVDAERTALAKSYTKQCKPKHDQMMQRLTKSMVEMHSAYIELHDMNRSLVDSGIGLHGLCADLPEFLSSPRDKYSEMAEFLREAKREGYIKEVPAELRL